MNELLKIRFVGSLGNDMTLVYAATTSTAKDPEEVGLKVIDKLIKWGHTSVLEHVVFQFVVELPIFIARQWMRHRVGWSYTERSGRYTKRSSKIYLPPVLKEFDKENQNNIAIIFDLIDYAYKHMLDNGVKKEDARVILPLGEMTEFFCTANLRAILHFLELRLNDRAQEEIRVLALQLYDIVKQVVPYTIEKWDEKRERKSRRFVD